MDDRFGSWGFGAGLSGLLLALAPFGHAVAALLLVAGLLLGTTGYARYVQGTAANRDAAVVGLATGGIGLLVLFVEAAATLSLPLEAYYWMP